MSQGRKRITAEDFQFANEEESRCYQTASMIEFFLHLCFSSHSSCFPLGFLLTESINGKVQVQKPRLF
jgi:hypothetical protein